MQRSDPDDDIEDPVAESLLSEDVFRRLRIEQSMGVGWTTVRRLQAQALIAAALALVYPLGSVAEVGESPVIVVVGVFGGAVVTGGAGAVTAVAIARLRADGDLTQTAAEELITLEELATMLSLVTGGAAVAATHVLFLAAIFAPETLAGLMRRDPFAPTGTPLTLGAVAAGALAVSATVVLLSRWLDAELQ